MEGILWPFLEVKIIAHVLQGYIDALKCMNGIHLMESCIWKESSASTLACISPSCDATGSK